jgi:hypothetical protein
MEALTGAKEEAMRPVSTVRGLAKRAACPELSEEKQAETIDAGGVAS